MGLEFSKEKKQVDRIKKERARQAIVDSPEKFKSSTSIEANEKPKSKPLVDDTLKDDNTASKNDNHQLKSPSDNIIVPKKVQPANDNVRKLKKINISDIADKIQKNTKLKGSPNKR